MGLNFSASAYYLKWTKEKKGMIKKKHYLKKDREL